MMALLARLLLPALAVACISARPTPQQRPLAGSAARPDRVRGGVQFGATVDWANGDTPAQFAGRLGASPAVVQAFVPIGASFDAQGMLATAAHVAAVPGCALAVTVQPQAGLDSVSDSALDQLACAVGAAAKSGVPVLLRWAHEMNAPWYPWGQRPAAYKAMFRRVAAAVKKYPAAAQGAAMVWSPNSPQAYPWGGAASATAELDTNGDGKVDHLDDPFTPYYPGDDVVDMVGFSTYAFGDATMTQNALPPSTLLADSIAYAPPQAGGAVVWDIYAFAQQRGKPLGLFETASAFHPNAPATVSDQAIKRAWLAQLFSADTLGRFPMLTMVVWFDVVKVDNADSSSQAHPDLRDFRISHTEDVVRAFHEVVAPVRDRVLFAPSSGSPSLSSSSSS